MKNLSICLGIIIFLIGCAAPLSVVRMPEAAIDSSDKKLVLLNFNTGLDSLLIEALENRGFKIKKFSGATELQKVLSKPPEEIRKISGANYGLYSYPGSVGDACMRNTSIKKYTNYTIKIRDLRTDKIILTVSKGGWPIKCAPNQPFVKQPLFIDLAAELNKEWH